MLLLIGWRGAPGAADEPQHAVQGRQTLAMLAAIEVEAFTMPLPRGGGEEGDGMAAARRVFRRAVEAARAGARPVAVLAPPNAFSGAKKVAVHVAPVPSAAQTKLPLGDGLPTREQAIGCVLRAAAPGHDAIVSTTGYTSREVIMPRLISASPLSSHPASHLSSHPTPHLTAPRAARRARRGARGRLPLRRRDGARPRHRAGDRAGAAVAHRLVPRRRRRVPHAHGLGRALGAHAQQHGQSGRLGEGIAGLQ